MSIQEHLNKIRNAIYGKEVRESIAKGIETAYDDASEKHNNANMEVKMARGTKPNLNARLDDMEQTDQEVAAQLAQKINKGEVTVSDIDKNKGKLDQTYLSEELLQQMAGTTPINAVPADGSITTKKLANNSVTSEKMIDITKKPITANLFNKNEILEGGYFRNTDGEWRSSSTISSSNFIPVKPYGSYRKTETRDFVLWDKNKNRVGGSYATQNITATEDTAYVTFAFSNEEIGTTMFWELGTIGEGYVPYEESYMLGKTWDVSEATNNIEDNSIVPTKLIDVTKTSKTVNLFDKNDIIEDGYFSSNTGNWENDARIFSSNFIEVEPLTQYKKSGLNGYALYDKDRNFISGDSNTDIINTTADTQYITFAFSPSLIDEMRLMKTSDWEKGYVPYEKTYSLGDSWSMKNQTTSNSEVKDLFLRVPTPYHDGTDDAWATHQTTHPSIHQFEEKWNGYKYWMAHTPYPDGKNPYENPCIAVSNNGIKWEEPVGVTNPLAEKPEGGYNSDTHIFYNEDTLKLEVWYREHKNSVDKETLFRVVSSDGSVWSQPEEMISVTGKGPYNLISPAIIFTDNEYKMWYMLNEYIVYATSPDGKDWSEPTNVLSGGERIWTWHFNVVLYKGQYHLINRRSGDAFTYGVSEPGKETEFSELEVIIGRSGNEWDLDGDMLYRASPIFTKHGVIVIYGVVSQQYKWTLIAASGRNLHNLKPVTQKAFDFYGIE